MTHVGFLDHSSCLIWERIRHQAADLMVQEPLLSTRLHNWIGKAQTSEMILANILGAKLGSQDLTSLKMTELCLSVYQKTPVLIDAAIADILAVIKRDPATLDELTVILSLKGFHALQIYRIYHHLWHLGRKQIALILAQESALIFGIDIHPGAQIGSGIMFDHGTGIVIGETAIISDDVSILQGVTLGGTGKEAGDRHPKIARGVLIGAGSTILGNIHIGEYSKVAAGSVVLSEVPARTTVAGVPAKVVRRHKPEYIPSFYMDQSI